MPRGSRNARRWGYGSEASSPASEEWTKDSDEQAGTTRSSASPTSGGGECSEAAAWDAAWDALAPTVKGLQASALLLLDRMIEVGKADAESVEAVSPLKEME